MPNGTVAEAMRTKSAMTANMTAPVTIMTEPVISLRKSLFTFSRFP